MVDMILERRIAERKWLKCFFVGSEYQTALRTAKK